MSKHQADQVIALLWATALSLIFIATTLFVGELSAVPTHDEKISGHICIVYRAGISSSISCNWIK